MGSESVYCIIFHFMNLLFWGFVTLTGMATICTAGLLFDSSILKEVEDSPGAHYSISDGVLGITLNNYIPDTQVLQFLLICAVIVMIFITAMFWNFRVLFKNASKGHIFVSSNTKSIFSIGIILFIQSFASGFPKVYIATKITPFIHIADGSFKISYSVNVILLIAAIFILFLGMFFKKAVGIAQENELTI
ncbi:DUF2975 domain-containing protein [Priestia aryabhattai]|uniref:DUF2975 domain-containing protein n=1 Tax=Priestia aryabhattai TaxID=412384 RepID=UPI001C0CCAAC|nr:DUF2975 domain-containing protein [Priestia aryabhattai]MBU3570050.1 DUF2975 domain-containing protein [Priestia aryabhattai]WDL87846.1 DUF2975 domain-containing protein [Priestia aryabhattai]